jgi:hypothetical protein
MRGNMLNQFFKHIINTFELWFILLGVLFIIILWVIINLVQPIKDYKHQQFKVAMYITTSELGGGTNNDPVFNHRYTVVDTIYHTDCYMGIKYYNQYKNKIDKKILNRNHIISIEDDVEETIVITRKD